MKISHSIHHCFQIHQKQLFCYSGYSDILLDRVLHDCPIEPPLAGHLLVKPNHVQAVVLHCLQIKLQRCVCRCSVFTARPPRLVKPVGRSVRVPECHLCCRDLHDHCLKGRLEWQCCLSNRIAELASHTVCQIPLVGVYVSPPGLPIALSRCFPCSCTPSFDGSKTWTILHTRSFTRPIPSPPPSPLKSPMQQRRSQCRCRALWRIKLLPTGCVLIGARPIFTDDLRTGQDVE